MANARYSENYIPVCSDSLGIIDRLKEIDGSYFVLLNHTSGRFEIHSSLQGQDSFCLELPFPFLDARTLTYVRRYRRERAKEIMEEIDRENEKLRINEAKIRAETLREAIENAKGGKNETFRND